MSLHLFIHFLHLVDLQCCLGKHFLFSIIDLWVWFYCVFFVCLVLVWALISFCFIFLFVAIFSSIHLLLVFRPNGSRPTIIVYIMVVFPTFCVVTPYCATFHTFCFIPFNSNFDDHVWSFSRFVFSFSSLLS